MLFTVSIQIIANFDTCSLAEQFTVIIVFLKIIENFLQSEN